ncbi:hypothetical protein H6F47_20970 [Sphaerospermopsis sp. FACHB-1094]|uniref:hypothetical protein n=1 Tax=Sphaerospermopsis sp. FACHB-1094 TaxID=2692861 RepID=UPI0016885CBF|nr:hypothetical protein [Sphaerospermopsis sp. FACHB-1094]MBD2134828.1 hypothetical protein [Sphaerospermopsis sp. FACHB-1094]
MARKTYLRVIPLIELVNHCSPQMINVFSLIPEHIREKLTLTDDKKQILQQQTISQHTPGTIIIYNLFLIYGMNGNLIYI